MSQWIDELTPRGIVKREVRGAPSAESDDQGTPGVGLYRLPTWRPLKETYGPQDTYWGHTLPPGLVAWYKVNRQTLAFENIWEPTAGPSWPRARFVNPPANIFDAAAPHPVYGSEVGYRLVPRASNQTPLWDSLWIGHVLYPDLYAKSEPGRFRVTNDGEMTFDRSSPAWGHRYLIERRGDEALFVKRLVDEVALRRWRER